MVTTIKQWLIPGISALALLALMATPCWGAGYTNTATPASQNPSGYEVFTAVEPSTQGATGWVANGQYNLPPDIGDVGLGISAAGSTATASDGTAEQNLVIRLDILDRGNRLFTIDPSGARLTDDTGHVVIGATAYSGNMQVAQITLGPGGRDDVQLAFALPSTMVVATLSAVSVDLPYMYGTRSDIAHFTFAPAQAAATPVGGGGAIYTPNVYNDYYIAPGYAGGYGSSYYPDLMSTWWGSDWGNPELAWADSSWWWTPGFPWWLSTGRFFDRDNCFGRGRFHRAEELREHQRGALVGNPAFARTPLAGVNTTSAQRAAAAATGRGEHAVRAATPGAVPERVAPRVMAAPRIEAPNAGQSRVFVAPGTEMRGAEPRTFTAPPAATFRFEQPRTFSAPRSFSAPAPRSFSSPGFSGSFRGGGSFSGSGIRGGGFSGGGSRGGGFSGGRAGGSFHRGSWTIEDTAPTILRVSEPAETVPQESAPTPMTITLQASDTPASDIELATINGIPATRIGPTHIGWNHIGPTMIGPPVRGTPRIGSPQRGTSLIGPSWIESPNKPAPVIKVPNGPGGWYLRPLT